MLKGPSALVRNVSSVNIRREFLNAFVRFFDICAKFRSRRQGRIAEPVVADHPLLTGIGDRARFELPHGCEGFLDFLTQLRIPVWEFPSANGRTSQQCFGAVRPGATAGPNAKAREIRWGTAPSLWEFCETLARETSPRRRPRAASGNPFRRE